ncbi:alpha/beta hydrolase [Saxibacter everestensis]|uniref:Alpha/beta hydrolase n=1 Tax=Saxibacter everestensis TaxID=2909229 RepID=A0ABY8QUD3_9MICO|nr:alpha/beta hydrolase [Brevibacteriaceae bacterium ZFBP1038]
MPETGRSGMKYLEYGAAWILDYVYIAFWQVHGFLFPASSEELTRGTDHTAAPVVLIPGVYETWQFMRPVADRLHELGHPIFVVESLGYNRGTIPAMAELTAGFLLERDLRNVVIVAHSKGGLIGKRVMSSSAQADRVSSMIAINTPFSGSVYARFAPGQSIRAFSPHNAILLKLAENLEVNERITSIYSSFDPHIPGGSFLQSATNVELDTMGHLKIIGDARLLDAIEQAL